MCKRICLTLMCFCWALFANAEEAVIRGAKTIRDGNLYASAVRVDFGDEAHPSTVIDMFRAMPRLEMLVIGGPRFEDRYLSNLAKIRTLRTLVLDSADVSDKALEKLRESRPELVIVRSQRLAIEAIQRLSVDIEVTSELSEQHPDIRRLLGDRHFNRATEVDFGRLPDDENGPFDRILNEELSSLRVLTTLRRLDLSWSRINDGGMYYLQPLTQLEYLHVPLDDVSADGLLHLRSMTNLKSFGGRIDDAGMRKLVGLKSLESLRISEDSGMTDIGLESIGQLKRLATLQLYAPQITGKGLRHLAELPRLQHLEMGAGVDDISALPNFPALRLLSLADAVTSSEALASLEQCRQLEVLQLDRTKVDDDTLARLSVLVGLYSISLSDTPVGDDGLAALQNLSQLRFLNLDRTRVTNSGLALLRKFAKLEDLSLYGMAISVEGIENLMKLKQLKSLSIRYPPGYASAISEQALHERLRRALPGCAIR